VIRKETAMATATMTSKGQLTVPKELRDRLGLVPGARLDVSLLEGALVLRPTETIEDKLARLANILPKRPKVRRLRTQKEIDAAIAAAVLARHRRSLK